MNLIFDTKGNEKQKLCAKYWIDNETSDIVYGGSKGSGKTGAPRPTGSRSWPPRPPGRSGILRRGRLEVEGARKAKSSSEADPVDLHPG